MNEDKKYEENKQFAIFVSISSFLLLFALFFLFKKDIGLWFFKIAYYDLLIGDFFYKTFHWFSEIPLLKKLFFNAYSVDFDWSSLSYIVRVKDGNAYSLIDYTIRYLWPINMIFFSILIGFEYFILLKLSRLSNKFKYEGIKNKQISLYFNDKKLQNFKRKTIKIMDSIKQTEVKQFAFNDYFPPFFPESETWFKNYIENSIYYSLHQINISEQRYSDIEKVWESIIDEHKIESKGKKILPVIKKYQFKRFEYMDKEYLLDDMETASKELSIFINDKNKNFKGVPVKNLFNSENANEIIRKYIKKYYNEYYINPEDMSKFEFLEEENEKEPLIDWTHILLEDLKVYFEVKLFRKSPEFSKTSFNSTKKNQTIKTPLLILEKFNEDEVKTKIINSFKRKGIQPTEKKVKEELDKIKREFEKRNAEKIVQAKKYYPNLKYLVLGIKDPKQVRFKQPVLKRTYIMTPFNGMKNLKKFEANGIQIPAEILSKYIIEDYEGSLRKQIKELKDQVNAYNQKGFFSMFKSSKKDEEEIENLKALIAELESRLDKNNEESRKASITKLLETHKFEETYLISLWEYGMNLVNLPTGRLSIIKKENIVLWYALTSLGRPFTFKAGVPIEVMRQIEIEKYSTLNKIKERFEDPDTTVRDFVSKEVIDEIKENSLESFDDDEDFII